MVLERETEPKLACGLVHRSPVNYEQKNSRARG